MTTTKFLAGAAAVLAFLALGTTGYKLHARHEAKSALTAADQERTRAVARVRELDQRARSAEQTAAGLQSALQTAQANATAEAEAAKPAVAWNEEDAGKAFQQRHPEITQALLEWSEAQMTGRFEKLWRSRGLTPEQVAEFKSLFSFPKRRHITDDQKFGQFYAKEGVDTTKTGQRLSALLGAEGIREYNRILEIERASTYPYELARALSFTHTPLTSEQANQLVQVVATASRRGVIDWDTIDRRANEVLTSDQLRAWRNLSVLGRAEQEVTLATPATQKAATAK